MIDKKLIQDWGKVDIGSLGLKEPWHGVAVFIGKQGSGKSVSALHACLTTLKNDDSKKVVYTNIFINDDRFIQLNEKEMADTISNKNGNGENCILLLDEIHLYYYSKNRNSQEVITPFSQLRKRNIIVYGTSQVWFHLDKTIRDQALFLVPTSQAWFGLYFKNVWVPTTGYKISDEGFLEITNKNKNTITQ